jgi:hypothetical protein
MKCYVDMVCISCIVNHETDELQKQQNLIFAFNDVER